MGFFICCIIRRPTDYFHSNLNCYTDIHSRYSKWFKYTSYVLYNGVQFSSVTQSCSTLCNPMDYTTAGFPVLHQLPAPAQTHLHQVSDAIQPSHPLLSPSPPAFNLSQQQGLFQWVNSLYQMAKVLEFQLQYRSFQWIVRLISFRDWLVWSPCSPRDSQESSPTPQFENINSWVLSLCYGPALTSVYAYWKNHSFDYMNLLLAKWCLWALVSLW